MLVLSRKEREGIRIDGGIVIWILEIRGERVKIAVDAPKDLTVLRAEIKDERDAAK